MERSVKSSLVNWMGRVMKGIKHAGGGGVMVTLLAVMLYGYAGSER